MKTYSHQGYPPGKQEMTEIHSVHTTTVSSKPKIRNQNCNIPSKHPIIIQMAIKDNG